MFNKLEIFGAIVKIFDCLYKKSCIIRIFMNLYVILKACWSWKRYRNQPINININLFTLKENEKSINAIVCESQKEYYSREFNSLSITELVPKDSKLLSLQPLLTDKIIKAGGWNKHANISFNQNHQMVINKNHLISKLVIKHIYESNFHCGREPTLATLTNK